jgi:hypothetical protein
MHSWVIDNCSYTSSKLFYKSIYLIINPYKRYIPVHATKSFKQRICHLVLTVHMQRIFMNKLNMSHCLTVITFTAIIIRTIALGSRAFTWVNVLQTWCIDISTNLKYNNQLGIILHVWHFMNCTINILICIMWIIIINNATCSVIHISSIPAYPLFSPSRYRVKIMER